MSWGKLGAYLLLLLTIGIVAFAAMGAIIEYRHGMPAPPERTAGQGLSPAGALVAGTRVSLLRTVDALRTGKRSEAVHALDAAMRAAKVGEYAAHGEAGSAFKMASRDIDKARRRLQNGSRSGAVKALGGIGQALGDSIVQTARTEHELPLPEIRHRYRHAQVLNAQGERLGEFLRFEGGPDGPTAHLIIGGARDVFGFLDFGGTRVMLPADRLVYGKVKTLGAIHVVVPVFGTGAEAVQRFARSKPAQREPNLPREQAS